MSTRTSTLDNPSAHATTPNRILHAFLAAWWHGDVVEAGDVAAARSAFGRAGGGSELRDWYKHCAAAAVGSRDPAALALLGLLIDADPDDWWAYAQRAEAYRRLGQTADREADLIRAVERGGDPELLVRRADEVAGRADWKRAAELLQLAIAKGSTDPEVGYNHGLACRLAGDAAGYRAACARLLAEATPGGGWGDLERANTAAKLCALDPGATDDWGRPSGLMDWVLRELSERKSRPSPEQK